jgi:DNA mismatch repair ATPase MutS
MQVGAFMQALDEDVRSVSQLTGLKLLMAGDIDDPVVRGGFPVTGLDAYVGRLVRAGHSVAIALQDKNKERRLSEVIRVRSDLIRQNENTTEGLSHGTV